MRRLRSTIAATSAFALVVTPISATMAQTPGGLADLVGARGSSGESALNARGYEVTDKSETTNNGRYTYWWNKSSKECIKVYTSDGRYASINEAKKKDCGKNNDGTAIAAAVGAAAIIGAIALATSGKNKDRDDNRYQSSLYTRGYNDGYAGRRYDGSGQEYSNGYGAGMRARNGYGNGNNNGYNDYRTASSWRSLRGRSNDYVDSELRNAGYVMREKSELGTGHERLYWQSRTETCLSVSTAGGDVRDIEKVRKRNCR